MFSFIKKLSYSYPNFLELLHNFDESAIPYAWVFSGWIRRALKTLVFSFLADYAFPPIHVQLKINF